VKAPVGIKDDAGDLTTVVDGVLDVVGLAGEVDGRVAPPIQHEDVAHVRRRGTAVVQVYALATVAVSAEKTTAAMGKCTRR
jgi:hypothetical protein